MKYQALIFAFCLFATVLALTPYEFQDNINVEMKIENTIHRASESLIISYSFTNTHTEAIDVLTWDSPLENVVNSEMFDIRSAHGEKKIVTYLGRIMNRVVPSAEHYISIEAGETVTGTLDIGAYYDFPVNGRYSVAFNFFAKGLGAYKKIESEPIIISVIGCEERVQPTIKKVDTADSAEYFSYIQCSYQQQSDIAISVYYATYASESAVKYMNGGCTQTYIQFFGDYLSSRYKTVETCFASIYNEFLAENFSINCDCHEEGVYAYVYPNDSHQIIYLCKAYWNANDDPFQYDSKPGTLTHEMSHFDAVCGTRDFAYGRYNCEDLAKTDPNTAINNADSYEYFQETGAVC